MANELDLGKLFQSVSNALLDNRDALNQADTYNHDHGDNMVEVFRVITQAAKADRKASPADQLAFASQKLRQRSNSGSARMYADGLAQAASEFQGKSITPDNALQLIQSIMGGGKPAAQDSQATQAAPDLLGSLLSGMMGGQTSSQPGPTPQAQPDLLGSLLSGMLGGQTPSQPGQKPQAQPDLLGSLLSGMLDGQSPSPSGQASQAQPDLLGSLLSGMMGGQAASQPAQTSQTQPDLLGSLMGGLMGGQAAPQQAQTPQAQSSPLGSLLTGLMGGQASPQQSDGLDVGDLMSAGLAFLNAKQQGKNSMEAILNALVAASQGGQTPYRAQSSAVVIKTLLQMIGSLSKN